MEQKFLSNDNINTIICTLKSKGFGNGLTMNELVDTVRPKMKIIYSKSSSDEQIQVLNNRVLKYFLRKISDQQLPSPVKVNRTQQLSDRAVKDFISKRNNFDESIGLKPMNYITMTKPKTVAPQKKKEVKQTSFLDEYFEIMDI